MDMSVKRLLGSVLGCAVLSSTTVSAETTADGAAKDIVETYAFDPAEMSYQEQAQRAPGLSELWQRCHDSPQLYFGELRKLLQQGGRTEMLYCDGGMLFLSGVLQPADRELGLKSIEKCSLAPIQYTPYFYAMHDQAVQGVDTLALQFKMLTKPEYRVFVVPHAMSLGQDFSFIYPLLVQEESRYVPRLIDRLGSEKDPVAQNTLLLALYFAATQEAESALQSAASSDNAPSAMKERAEKLISNIEQMREMSAEKIWEWMEKNGEAVSPGASEDELRSARRQRMRAISDEALMAMERYTLLIYQARK
jgi:hypothetical protein